MPSLPNPVERRPASPAQPRRKVSSIPPLTPHLFVPSAQRPVRAKQHHLRIDTRVVPHSHPWAQLCLSRTGVVRLTVPHGTFIVPPSRALWIPPGVEHAVTVLEDSTLCTLYFHQAGARCGPGVARADEAPWRECRVLEVSDLLRALVLEMNIQADGAGPPLALPQLQRERRLAALVLDELRIAKPVPLGVNLPRDKRLRALCEAVLEDPVRWPTLEAWARDVGASPRTVARLFRQQLGTTFGQWRQQVLLARALTMAAGAMPMNRIAAELGYASPSAFSAMVRRSVGAPPSRFFASL
jgi:AraC-like DNA-binding protein